VHNAIARYLDVLGARRIMLRKFFRSEQGNYTVIFALALVPIMTGLAGVVDYATTTRDAASLQNTLDAAGLAVATKYYSGMSQADLETLGSDVFTANLHLMDKQEALLISTRN
jgi:Flp pilus assembly protein TadG